MYRTENNNGNALLVIDVDSYSMHVINKAYRYARNIEGKLYVLFLKSPKDGREDEMLFIRDELYKLMSRYKIEDFGTETLHDLDVYIKTLKEKYIQPYNVTAIIRVNHRESWIGDLIRGSLSNFLASYFPHGDALLIGDEHIHPFDKGDFAAGKRMYVSKSDGHTLRHMNNGHGDISGLYFKEKATDFEHGIFMKELSEGETQYKIYKVVDGRVELSQTAKSPA